MRALRIVLLGLVLLVSLDFSARADEKFATLKAGSTVYTHVTITEVTSTDVYFTSDQGMANAKLKNLEPEMQKHFHFDAAKANAAAQKQKEAAALYASLDSPNILDTIARKNAQTIMDAAVGKAKAIINQPVQSYPFSTSMVYSQTLEGVWFHPGATRPDFNSVDIRKTQDLSYGRHGPDVYVTCALNSGLAFLGTDLEFNSMTKFFYVDRSLPKKKLTQDEMLEINRLYRIIGKCEQKGATLPH